MNIELDDEYKARAKGRRCQLVDWLNSLLERRMTPSLRNDLIQLNEQSMKELGRLIRETRAYDDFTF